MLDSNSNTKYQLLLQVDFMGSFFFMGSIYVLVRLLAGTDMKQYFIARRHHCFGKRRGDNIKKGVWPLGVLVVFEDLSVVLMFIWICDSKKFTQLKTTAVHN